MTLEENTRVIFFHVPKTAGTSLHNLLVARLGADNLCPERFNGLSDYSQSDLAKYRFFSGHFDWNNISQIPGPTYKIIMMRNPRDRILSLYYFWRAHSWEAIEKRQLSGPRIAKENSLLDFLDYKTSGIQLNINNVYARKLLGHGYSDDIGSYVIPEEYVAPICLQQLEKFDSVGITEKMDDSVAAIMADLGFRRPPKVPHLRSQDDFEQQGLERVIKEEITPAIEKRLRELTRFDDILYTRACQIATERMSHLSP